MRLRLRPWRRPALHPTSDVPDRIVGDLLREAIERDGLAMWRARGTSMRGAIEDGALVRLVAVRPRAVHPGAVVLAHLPDERLVLHRVERCVGERVQLRGDALRRPDLFTSVHEVIGVADPCPRPNRSRLLFRLLP